jgi:hypothetical protein
MHLIVIAIWIIVVILSVLLVFLIKEEYSKGSKLK